MSARTAAALRAIAESQDSVVTADSRLTRAPHPHDPLPPEERAGLRLLAEFPGAVGRSPLGAILDHARMSRADTLLCSACHGSGWVMSDRREREEFRRSFDMRVQAYAAQAARDLSREADAAGQPLDDLWLKMRATAIGQSRALEDESETPWPGSAQCQRCDGSGLIPAPVSRPRADPNCPVCAGTGRQPGPRSVVRTPSGSILVRRTVPCRCLPTETVHMTGSSIKSHTAYGDGPDPEWLSRIGHLSHRMAAVLPVYSLALDIWYSPAGCRLECLWPLTDAGQRAISGLDRNTRTWRATVRVRRGGEMLVAKADEQAERLLSEARRAWMSTLEETNAE